MFQAVAQYDSVGQNIAAFATGKKSSSDNFIPVWDKTIQMWYDEIKDYSKEWVDSFQSPGKNGETVGHFTQVPFK